MLFGPNWTKDFGEECKDIRLEILLDAPPGSVSYSLTEALLPNIDPFQRSPRPAMIVEQIEIAMIRRIQGQRADDTELLCVTDLLAVLKGFESPPNSFRTLFRLAINTMPELIMRSRQNIKH